jgi:hypothetical protein
MKSANRHFFFEELTIILYEKVVSILLRKTKLDGGSTTEIFEEKTTLA